MNVLLNHIKSMSDPFELSIQRLSQKVVTLLALSNADRASDIYLLNIEHMRISNCEAKFQVAGLSKTRRSGPPREVTYHRFTEKEICPVHNLEVYLTRTKETRGNCKSLFISCKKPHKQVSTSTLSQWMKSMLTEAGIDTDLFKGHSVRTAAASAAHKAGASIKDILKAGNWRRESTFRKFYYKSPQPSGFALAVLNGMCHNHFKQYTCHVRSLVTK